ncbi:carbohydrate-responsive element-binding protein-like [Gigantopelta aegis]|uniref:carbohydrate-responsive element-binding protein-like n=1 Tax=Gigantopelta aegis TaxID=1735272 RepID=UPI001B88B926|nr:carbohydrate-responsive element-binding protein-like [Gigantopelta aegis]
MSPSPYSSSSSPKMTVHSTSLKVKRKCGRPRNPIPRHKRESHINAEHRRRGKIQNGFQTLKNIVPQTGDTPVIRDSKADILFKAVDHSRKLQAEYNEQKQMINQLYDEMKTLKTAIEFHQKHSIPEENHLDEKEISVEDRLEEYIQERTRKNWTFWILSFFIRPLFESYNSCVSQASLQSFISSVVDWASRKLTLTALRTVAFGSLLSMTTETSILSDTPNLPEEAFLKMTPPSDDSCFDLDHFYPEKDSTLASVANKDVSLNSAALDDPMMGSLPGIDVLLGSDVNKDVSLSTLDFKDLAFGSLLCKDFSLGSPSCKNLSDLSLSSLIDKDFNLGTFVLDEPTYIPL